MDTELIKNGLQDLIYRLQDAEKGYRKIISASNNTALNKWLERYAKERHEMHQKLESYIIKLGGKPEVDTTYLGKLHRMFIEIKINNTSAENEFEAIVTEIERGATTLISDYEKVMSNVKMPAPYVATLNVHKATIQSELDTLLELREEFKSKATSM
jgi:uncharacterized protein (TIGR02284 family)